MTDAGDAGGSDRGSAGDGGDAAVSVTYLGCTFIGGINRIVVAKRDTARDLCLSVVLQQPASGTTAGLTVPATFGLERAFAGAASQCPSRQAANTAPASTVTGTIAIVDPPDGGAGPTHVSADLTLTFAANDAGAAASERIVAPSVDLRPGCN